MAAKKSKVKKKKKAPSKLTISERAAVLRVMDDAGWRGAVDDVVACIAAQAERTGRDPNHPLREAAVQITMSHICARYWDPKLLARSLEIYNRVAVESPRGKHYSILSAVAEQYGETRLFFENASDELDEFLDQRSRAGVN